MNFDGLRAINDVNVVEAVHLAALFALLSLVNPINSLLSVLGAVVQGDKLLPNAWEQCRRHIALGHPGYLAIHFICNYNLT